MALEDILSRIEHEAEVRKRSILADAQDEAESHLQRARNSIEKEAELVAHKRKREAELLVQRELAEANLQGRNQIGQVKSAALQETRQSLMVSLLKAFDQAPEVWGRNILLKNTTSRDENILMAAPEAERLGKTFIDQLNNQNKTAFTYGGVTDSIDRGFVMRKKGMILTLSIQSLAEDAFRAHEREVATLLFQDPES